MNVKHETHMALTIDTGLFPHMVVQRTAEDVSDATFTGGCQHAGEVIARVTRDGMVVPGFDGLPVGQAADGAFTGRLVGVPVGGPYTVELQVGDECAVVEDVLVGDVWIIAGQSNAQGFGNLIDAEPPHPLVRAFYMDDRWEVAADPLHNIWDAVDQVHADLCGGVLPGVETRKGVGYGVSFGVEMQRRTGVPQGVIASAHGGTAMAQWTPRYVKRGGRSLYGALLRRVRKNGGRVAGIVWYQGCSDTSDPDAVARFSSRVAAFVRAVRKDLGHPDLPIAMVQIARLFKQVADRQGWNGIQERQRRLPERISHCTVVPAIDLVLDDYVHIGGTGQQALGRRLASAMAVLKGWETEELPPIEFAGITLREEPVTGTVQVVVRYTNVMGGLTAAGLPSGFAVVDEQCASYVYRTDLAGDCAILAVDVPIAELAEKALHYGHGTTPYCNITDRAGRSLPVMGPIRLGTPRALTPFLTSLRVTPVMPVATQAQALAAYPERERREMASVFFPGNFCDLHQAIRQYSEPAVVYYACEIDCPEPMRLAALLGYDGPVALWVDGERLFADPAGANPARPDAANIAFTATAGPHELLVALDTNGGRAWGIFLRLERLDVPTRRLAQGTFVLPAICG